MLSANPIKIYHAVYICEKKKKKRYGTIALQQYPSSDAIFMRVHSESIFPFMEFFFFSRKLCFLWSPCLLLIAESISLDTSGKPTVGFSLKITSPSWIILSMSLDELNSFNWLLKSWWWIFLKFYFIVVKEFWYGKKILQVFWRLYLFEYYFLNVIVNVNFVSDLKFEYKCEHYPEILLQISLK